MNGVLPSWSDNKFFTVIVGIVLIILAVFLISESRNSLKENYFIGKNPDLSRSITISGEGEAVAVPDIAIVNLGHSVTKSTVSEAQSESTRVINELVTTLKSLGIDAKDIQTTNYSVYPQYDYNNGTQTLRGYNVNQNVKVKIRDSAQVSSALDLIGKLELNQVGGISFEIDDIESVRQEARLKALENAQAKAEQLASVMGVGLGKVVSFSESSQGSYPQPYLLEARSDAVSGFGGGGAAIEQGSQEITIIATVTYELD